MNLLLAAAIAGAPTPGQEEEKEDSEDEKEKEEVPLEKVLEMWKTYQAKDGMKDFTLALDFVQFKTMFHSLEFH